LKKLFTPIFLGFFGQIAKPLILLDFNLHQLHLINSGDFDLAQSLKTATQSVFLEFRQTCDSVSNTQVIERLAEATIERIIETRFLEDARKNHSL